MAMYYVMEYDDPPEGLGYTEIEDGEAYDDFKNWRIGRLDVAVPPERVVIEVTTYDGYQANNIIFHSVVLWNREMDQRYAYQAFNLVGLISATDLQASKIESHDGDFMGDSSIKNFSFVAAMANGTLIFRLAEKFSAILVHETVRRHIESCGINTLKFTAPENYYRL